MMRRLIATVVGLLLSGLLPLAASGGFCASKPCCRAHTPARTAALGTHPECCSETNCDTTANRLEATNAKTTTVQPQLAATVGNVQGFVVALAMTGLERRIDKSPPPMRERLATLSTLLI